MKATESYDLRADSIERKGRETEREREREEESDGENVREREIGEREREREREPESATHPFTQGCTWLTE